MEWVLRSPQIHSIFSNLGFAHGDGYNINENCNAALETILHHILTEDKYLRTFRRNISFGQNIRKDLIPLLIQTKEQKTIELLVRILVNITIPVECLLSIEDISKSDFGRHTIFEIKNLLVTTKNAFTDQRATKVVIDFLKKNMEVEQQSKLTIEQCTNISNSLLLLRNILHIPEENHSHNNSNNNSNNKNTNNNNNDNNSGMTNPTQNNHEPNPTVQNQILWNIFSQSIDKILIKLMTIPEATNWAVTMVQVIALLYKDQHVATLHKYLNLWLEASLTESSEDNESNTSPPVRGSEDSSPVLTSNTTSDSSDTEGSGKSNDATASPNNEWSSSKNDSANAQTFDESQISATEKEAKNVKNKTNNVTSTDVKKSVMKNPLTFNDKSQKEEIKNSENTVNKVISESSDCGYGTHIENQESVSTATNENVLPDKKPVQLKPNPLLRISNTQKRNLVVPVQEKKRKKIVKRSKADIINVQGLSHQTPTDDDISNILKEFTLDFLLKGYNTLVQTLHNQILNNLQLEMDTSHFFWLVTYFLKFAMQIELDLEHISSVLSFEVVSYLTSEGVNLCEQFELAIKLDGNDLRPNLRRLHLVVTAIREFVQAIEVYKGLAFKSEENTEALSKLQIKICDTEELRLLLVLLLRTYNTKYHTKQYLQDLVVTNHILLMFVDNVIKLPNYKGSCNFFEHIKQFATPELMSLYAMLLEDYRTNGDFVNDCIFTLMHHIAGEIGGVMSLYQPSILKTFTSIWTSNLGFCEDWSDLIEYVINTFVKNPAVKRPALFDIEDVDSLIGGKIFSKTHHKPTSSFAGDNSDVVMKNIDINDCSTENDNDMWTDEEISSLSWNYMQCHTLSDVIGEIVRKFADYGISKSRECIINGLFKQNIIAKDEYEMFCKGELDSKSKPDNMVNKEGREDEIRKLCDQLIIDGKLLLLDWVQKVLLEICYAKIFIAKKAANKESKIMDFALFKNSSKELPVVSPVSYYSLILHKSVPLVPWNCEHAAICKDLKFLQLLHRLGFQMPVDTGKVFIRIPHEWTADILFEIASKVSPIDTTKLKFSINDISDTCVAKSVHHNKFPLSEDLTKDIPMIPIPESSNLLPSHIACNIELFYRNDPPFNIEGRQTSLPSWFDVVKKSQDCNLSINMGSTFETASVASDLTRMYVSDADDK